MGEPPPIAPSSRLEAASVQTPRADPSLLRLIASPDLASRVSDWPLSRLIHNDLSAVSDASNAAKMADTSPMVAGIEIFAGETLSGDAGDEESALIDDGFWRPSNGARNGRPQRLPGH